MADSLHTPHIAALQQHSGVCGVGMDIVSIAAFTESYHSPGTRFAQAFSATEQRQVRERRGSSPGPEQHLAARWAAKEAVIKAWSQVIYGSPPRLAPEEVVWREIETVCDAFSRPSIRLGGVIKELLTQDMQQLDPQWTSTGNIHLSLSHDEDTACAVVVLSR